MKENDQKIVDRVHDYEFEMLCKLDDVCRKYDITYYLEAGTLIGAVRHKDFIPWDDDIDIYFKRKDLKKLIAHKDELYPYILHVPNANEGFFWDFTARLMDYRVNLKKDDEEAKFYNNTNCQKLFMDLFIMDSYPGGFRGKLQVFELKLLYVLAMSRRYKMKYDAPNNPIARFALFLLIRFGRLIPFKSIFSMYDRISRRYNKTKGCKELILSNVSATFMSDSIYKKKFYRTRAELPVRGRNFFVPGDYDGSLRSYYGDYMQLPPEDKRFPDHIDSIGDVAFLDE